MRQHGHKLVLAPVGQFQGFGHAQKFVAIPRQRLTLLVKTVQHLVDGVRQAGHFVGAGGDGTFLAQAVAHQISGKELELTQFMRQHRRQVRAGQHHRCKKRHQQDGDGQVGRRQGAGGIQRCLVLNPKAQRAKDRRRIDRAAQTRFASHRRAPLQMHVLVGMQRVERDLVGQTAFGRACAGVNKRLEGQQLTALRTVENGRCRLTQLQLLTHPLALRVVKAAVVAGDLPAFKVREQHLHRHAVDLPDAFQKGA